VERVRFAPGPLPETTGSEAPPPAPPPPSPEHRRRAAELAAALGDEALRERVERAIGLSLARGGADRSV
jgi:hypothetical protein